MGGDGDGAGSRVTSGPFTFGSGNWTLNVVEPFEPNYLRRTLGVAAGSLPSVSQLKGALDTFPYDSAPWNDESNPSFRNRLEGWYGSGSIHNRVHVWVGGNMLGCASPNDPVFWLHHCNIDRLWARWQEDNGEPYLPVAGAPQGHNLNDGMWPWMTPPRPTPESVLDHRALGYSYDTLSIQGDMVQTEGKLTLLRVNDRNRGYGPPLDRIEAEGVVHLDSEPGKAFGFRLRNDSNYGVHKGMLDSLRLAFNCNRTVRIEYVHTGSQNHYVERATLIA
jgi:hypothetical protein